MGKVIIVDYQLGNLFSVEQACKKVGMNVEVSQDAAKISAADAIILPGVGAYKAAMDNLKSLGLIDPIKTHIAENKPFMGICLGLQLLFESSEEFGEAKGLGIIEGVVKRFPMSFKGEDLYIPHVGWNKVIIDDQEKDVVVGGVKNESFFYFVHSYYVVPKKDDVVFTKTNYAGFEFCSSVLRDNIFATQFHPEKSGHEGLTVYRDWAEKNDLVC